MKTVLVTGGARRIGRGVAQFLGRKGLQVAVHYHRSKADALSVVSQLHAEGCEAFCLQGDLFKESDCEQLILRVVVKYGGIDVLVNNASSFSEDSVMDFGFAQFTEHMKVNAFAPLLLCRAFQRHCNAGCIVNFLDSRVGDNDSAHASYHLSKRVFDSITRMLAVELAPHIRVNAVAPGLILPPDGKGDEYVEMRKKEVPLQKQGSVYDICVAVDFLIQSNFVTGQTVFVDGGRHLNGAFYGE